MIVGRKKVRPSLRNAAFALDEIAATQISTSRTDGFDL